MTIKVFILIMIFVLMFANMEHVQFKKRMRDFINLLLCWFRTKQDLLGIAEIIFCRNCLKDEDHL